MVASIQVTNQLDFFGKFYLSTEGAAITRSFMSSVNILLVLFNLGIFCCPFFVFYFHITWLHYYDQSACLKTSSRADASQSVSRKQVRVSLVEVEEGSKPCVKAFRVQRLLTGQLNYAMRSPRQTLTRWCPLPR